MPCCILLGIVIGRIVAAVKYLAVAMGRPLKDRRLAELDWHLKPTENSK
jgi:hypothetical protein